MTDWIQELKLGFIGAAQRTETFAAKHPRALTGTVVGLLSGFAVTAFGIAPLSPDAADLPRQVITESVVNIDLEAQLAALAAHELELTRNDLTRGSDTADSLLRRLGAFDPQAAAFLRTDALGKRVLQGRPGKRVQVLADASGRVESLIVRFPAERAEQANTHFSRLSIKRGEQGFSSQLEAVPLRTQVKLGSGSVRSSLFAATDEAGIPDAIATQMADMLSGDIDFHRDLRKGDRFSVVYETLTADGEPITWDGSAGRVLAAEFVNNGRAYSAVWFKDSASGKGSFYSFDGQNKRRAFLASPMEFSRVTSGFAMRFHPILQKWRAHLGTDFGAPTGTPVRTVGDGAVEFAGWQNGFGNVVHIRHAGDRTTVYAHLSRIDVKKGQRVEQGQRVGAVGATGWATGPHLHFEFRVNGQHQDPRLIAKASESIPLPATARAQFGELVASIKTQLTVAESIGTGVSGAD
ncbi:M23 family metallopeptidase [Roseateles toxinivorans]|uniref:Murein DD-endopeptidase MepM/ murein hydrolase activator NlpD n=1 Tax=Roseateles toxinivorans TaxID=270368 RepID=A0A4R6QIR8_9BURK|nr:M23 family metallopeptidase [Roseateles toxinivorans]TDP62723.1 murein DD-endopeptidase MepM/ murein hydrolase activator NlpD [Roseateles toxinivorans]